ncbi:MAG: hypothetical protein WC028_29200 [Candidatus Obscuribacterales bacterium]
MATLALAQTNQTNESAQSVKQAPVIQTSTGSRSTLRHLQLAPSGGRQAKDNTLPPMTHYLGLIELDVALTKLAIHKQPTENSVPKHPTEATSASNETVFFRWGQSHNKRSFALNEDGSAQYMVKTGETVISIVECLLREKHRMCPSYEPSYREIRTEIRTLRLANLDLQDLDLLEKGQWVTIPALIVCEALTGQGKLSA